MYETPDDFITAIDMAEDEEEWKALAKHLMSQIVKSSDSRESERFIEAVLHRLPSSDVQRLLQQEADGWTAMEKASFGSEQVSQLIMKAQGKQKLLTNKTVWSAEVVAGSSSKETKQKSAPTASKSKSKSKPRRKSS